MTDRLSPLIQFPTACPCCGYDTLDARGEYDICKICWWEDDGQDNDDANIARGGPNSNLSLTRARLNFLEQGIFQPSREDLREIQESIESHPRRRIFEFNANSLTVSEPETGWSTTIAELDDNPHSPYFSVGAAVLFRRRCLDTDLQRGIIIKFEWYEGMNVWRYRLSSSTGTPVEQWYNGASLRAADRPPA